MVLFSVLDGEMEDLKNDFKNAKGAVSEAKNALYRVLDRMVDAGMAKIIDCDYGECEIYIVGEKSLLEDIQYAAFEGDPVPQFWGVDADGRAEAEEQGCDPDEFCDVIMVSPNEIEWFYKE